MYLFLHGLIGSPDHWTPVIQKLPKSEPVLADYFTDYLQHEVTDVAQYYRKLLGPYRRQGGKITVVGNSLGCVTALHLQDIADDMVLTAPPFDFDQGEIPLVKSKLEPYVRTLLAGEAAVPDVDMHVRKACEKIEALMQSRRNLLRIRSLKKQAQSFVETGLLARVGERATVVIGQNDFTTQEQAFRRFMKSRAPRAGLHVLPQCGHAVPLEQPQALAQILMAVDARSGQLKLMDAVF